MPETTGRGLTAAQLALLLQPIAPQRVRQHKGQAHVEAWDVRRWLTRIFGFGGWSDEILSCECVHEVTWPVMEDGKPVAGKHRCTAVYRVTMRLIVRDEQGNEIGHWDDGATGDGINQVSVGDAHDMALKTAMSQALKRCAVNLGDQFGLSLYNKGSLSPAVLRTAAHSTAGVAPQGIDPQQDAPVKGGELDDERVGPDEVADAVARKAQRERRTQPPGDDPWTQNPPATDVGGPTTRMLTALAALASKKRGVAANREARLNLMRSFLPEQRAVQIRSGKDLTFDEAKRIIGILEREPDLPPPVPVSAPNPRNGDVPVDPAVEAALALPTLTKLVERAEPGAGVFEQLKPLIRDARSDEAMEQLINTAIEAGNAGHITKAQYDTLCEIGRQRSEAMHSDEGWSHRMLDERTGAPA